MRGASLLFRVLFLSALSALPALFLTAPLYALNFNDALPPDELAARLADSMSDEELLAETFMFGWKDGASGPSPLILEWIEKRGIGGVKVFGWNTRDIVRLSRTIGEFQERALRRGAGVPLLVATDQEGGFVRHVKDTTSETPPAMAIGASGFPADAFKAGCYIGRELRVIGINMNFAPTVDLFINHNSLLIGSRSFGDDPVKTGVLAAAFARGLLEAGIIPTAKHFPGHGATEQDSHGILPKIEADFPLLWERELVPYRMLAKEKIPAIMSGHIAFPKTEAKLSPASLSSYFLQDILRKKINFEGLIITDDLAMNGATSGAEGGRTLSVAAKEALLAGNDMIMISRTPELNEALWTNLLSLMKKDAAFRQRIKDAAWNVLKTKLKYLKGERAVPYIPAPEKVKSDIPDKEGAAFFQDLAARSITVVKGGADIFPLTAAKAGKVLLVKGGHDKSMDFFAVGRLYYKDAPRCWYAPEFMPVFLDLARNCDTIVFYLRESGELEGLRRVRDFGKKVIVLSASSPVYLEAVPWVDGALALYSDSYESLLAGFSALCGKIEAQGTLPFKME